LRKAPTTLAKAIAHLQAVGFFDALRLNPMTAAVRRALDAWHG